MERIQFKRLVIRAQVIAWTALFLMFALEGWDYYEPAGAIIYGLVEVLLYGAAVYIHYAYLLPFWKQQRLQLYIGSTILLLSTFALLFYFKMILLWGFDDTSNFWIEDFGGNFLYYLLLIGIFVAASSLFYFVEAWHTNLQKETELKNEKLQAELSFLRSQINPHFLFNTLNNIYAYAQSGHEKTAPMIDRLSSILRFMVYDCQEERVELNKEYQAINDLLEIYKMKNSAQQNIRLRADGIKRYHLIAPLILVNLVENACKHSDAVNNPEGFIHVDLSVNTDQSCTAVIANSMKKSVQHRSGSKYGGVGLDNVLKRLQLQYGDQYQMAQEIQDHIFELTVQIPLERK
ncbi:MAG: histidine kinase [Bacteroidota bacterium]